MKRTLFSDEHELCRQSFHKFLDREVVPHHEKWQEEGMVSREVWRQAGDHGVLCPWAAEKYGGSEADFVFMPDGSLLAVVRNEAGEGSLFGSKICRAPSDDRGNWTCIDDGRKFDSPFLFRNGSAVYLVARRNVTDDGLYDLELEGTRDQLYLTYQISYWTKPKRCSLWRIPDRRCVLRVGTTRVP